MLHGALAKPSRISHNGRMNPDDLIVELVENRRIARQSEILGFLQGQGWELDQSTLSRHLRRLGIRKLEGRYRLPPEPKGIAIAADLYVSPPNLLIVRTNPGHAQAAAYRIDSAAIEGVLGSVGGDDTVFVAVEPSRLESVRIHLIQLFEPRLRSHGGSGGGQTGEPIGEPHERR
jgi:transcriptional regulator of arginine metabolism